jgi:murein DD-endopeptidase MepM/ murein hydrolase activator NlpD
MPTPLPSPIRVHGAVPSVVVVLLMVALLSLARPAGALGAPVDPVPVGVWPLEPQPEVVRAFEPPAAPFGPGHRGVDLAGSLGQPVLAALAGRVSFAGSLAGRGVVVVDHGSTRTTYEPVAAGVRVGQPVLRGQPIGSLTLGGSHCFPRVCLHWGWRRGDTYLDPLLLVGGGPIRLLPLWVPAPAPRASPRRSAPPYAGLPARVLAGPGRQMRTSVRAGPRWHADAPGTRARPCPGRGQARGWAWR